MIVTGKESYVQGSSALAPEVVTKQKKKNNSNKRKRIKVNQDKIVRNKLKIIRNIFCIFVVGVIIVGRYSKIYGLQREVNSINSTISKLNKENENLRVQLVKYSNIQYVEELSTNKLKMIKPDKNNLVYCDLKKQLVKVDNKLEDKNLEKNQSVMKKFFSKLF